MTFTEYKRDINRQINIVETTDERGFKYETFENVPDEIRLTEKDKGNRVWIASYPRTTKAFLHDIRDDGIFVKFKGEVPIRAFYEDEVILHKDLWTKKRLNFSVNLSTKFS